jgi:hypothetical protein
MVLASVEENLAEDGMTTSVSGSSHTLHLRF